MSGQGCGVGCARIMLIIFNVVFWLSGAALLAIGIWMLVDEKITDYLDFIAELQDSGELLKYSAYALIAVGAFVFLVGFLGCCGALKQNRCLLGLYIFFMVIVMAAEIAAGVLGIIFKDKIEDKLEEEFISRIALTNKTSWAESNTDKTAFVEATIKVQEKFDCCGWNGIADYNGIGITSSDDMMSCKDHENTGCEDGVKEFVTDNSVIIIGVGIGIGCLELFGFIFAVCLCRNIED